MKKGLCVLLAGVFLLAAMPPSAVASSRRTAGEITLATSVAQPSGRIDVIGRGQDSGLWQKTFNGVSWGDWRPLGVKATADPALVSSGAGRLYLFFRGGDFGLWYTASNDGGDTWGAWAALGGVLKSAPVVTSWGTGRLDVFAVGFDRSMWQKTYDPFGGWAGWRSLGGQFTSSATAVSWASGRIDVFSRGLDLAVWHRYYQAGWSAGWESIGGVVTTAPTVAAWSANRLDIFAGGQDRALWHAWWDGGAWGGWQWLGGYLTGDPSATSSGINRLDIFASSTDRAVWQRSWNGAFWEDWRSIGGVVLAGNDPLPLPLGRPLPAVIAPGSEWSALPTSRPIVALTFDAGSGDEGLTDRVGHPSILTTLQQKGVPATFFLTGQWVDNFPQRAALLAGFSTYSVGNHSYDHPSLTQLPSGDVAQEIVAAERIILRTTGRQPAPLFRFPYGDRDSRTISVANGLGYGNIRWTVDTLGWKGAIDPATGQSTGQSVQTVIARAVGARRAGEIVLMHLGAAPDGSTLDADALPSIIDQLRAYGYGFVAIGAFIGS